jgi:hypothetical protein
MAFDPGGLEEILRDDLWQGIAEEFDRYHTLSGDVDLPPEQQETVLGLWKSVTAKIDAERRRTKMYLTILGFLKPHVEGFDFTSKGNEVLSEFGRMKDLSSYGPVSEFIANNTLGPDSRDLVLSFISKEVERLTNLVERLSAQSDTLTREMESVESYFEYGDSEELFGGAIQMEKRLEKLLMPYARLSKETSDEEPAEKQEKKVNFDLPSNDEPTSRGYTSSEAGEPAPEYSKVVKDAMEKSKSSKLVNWGDLTSDEEEETSFVTKLSDAVGEGKPFIEIPSDLGVHFPFIEKLYRRIAKHWDWEVKLGVAMAGEGFIAINFEKLRGTKEEKVLSESQRIALNTLIVMLLAPQKRCDQIKKLEKGSVVSGYVTSLVLIKDSKTEEDKAALKIALKNADGGFSIIKNRVHECFRGGSTCATMMINNFIKMISKSISIATEADLEAVRENKDCAFTSGHGMLMNCCKVVTREETKQVETVNRRGKTERKTDKIKVTGKDIPYLKVSSLELTADERAKLLLKQTEFNKFIEVHEQLCKGNKHHLTAARAAMLIIESAYDRIGELRRTSKVRRQAIRVRAIELAGEKGKINQANWLKARSEVLDTFEGIPDKMLESLEWDIPALKKSLKGNL